MLAAHPLKVPINVRKTAHRAPPAIPRDQKWPNIRQAIFLNRLRPRAELLLPESSIPPLRKSRQDSRLPAERTLPEFAWPKKNAAPRLPALAGERGACIGQKTARLPCGPLGFHPQSNTTSRSNRRLPARQRSRSSSYFRSCCCSRTTHSSDGNGG